jgi:ubiquitin-conjugating enzyme E2 G1
MQTRGVHRKTENPKNRKPEKLTTVVSLSLSRSPAFLSRNPRAVRSRLHVSNSEGGFFTANMSFPPDYPNEPPSVKFVSDVWHPNVYSDGRVCISILHAPGEDPNGYEHANERWSPVQTVETIMLSIISMLSSPNDESPANIDAAKQFREDFPGFRKRVSQCVRRSQEQ